MPKKEEKLEEGNIKEEETEVAVEVPESDIAAETVAEPVPDEITADVAEDSLLSEFGPEVSSDAVQLSDNETVTVKSVQFASFEDASRSQGEVNKNLDILMDIKLQMTVELGRTELPIRKVLELTRGSIIELEKIAGEPVELYANGKLVANGEVVVIEDHFGLRITNITDPEDRLKGIGQ